MICVFIGPTLQPDDVRAELDAVCFPPARAGDIYKVALQRPQAIGIIDGYAHRVSALWHKEILWAMSQGIPVFGSAGMGALRAIELESFGMVGVGKIFEAYKEGEIEDDDEVATTYGAADAGYPCFSEAMVNIRATLAAAGACGIVDPATAGALERVAKSLFYPERSYVRILERAASLNFPASELNALRQWLPTGRVNPMREDALAMLRMMRERLGAVSSQRVQYEIEHTVNWDKAMRHWTGEVQQEGRANDSASARNS